MTWNEYGTLFRGLITHVTVDDSTILIHLSCVRHYVRGTWQLYRPIGTEVLTTAWRIEKHRNTRVTTADDGSIRFDLLKGINSFCLERVARPFS
jgi:hypothetical protein